MKIKINSMNTESNPSDDEIRSYMNFDRVVDAAKQQSRKRKLQKIWIVLPIFLTLFSAWYLATNRSDMSVQSTVNNGVDGTNIESKESSISDLKKESDQQEKLKGALTEVPANTEKPSTNAGEPDRGNSASNGEVSEAPKTATGNDSRRRSSGSGASNGEKSTPPDVYVQAEPSEGYAHLYGYFSDNLNYPQEAMKDSIEGVETVSFTIDEQGRPANIIVTHSLGKPFDLETIRLVSAMPLWRPATLNGRPVASQLSLPLTFEIKRIQKN